MRKTLTFILLLLCLSALTARAQNAHEDSVKKIAIADGQKFKLDKARLTVFRKNARQMARDYYFPGGRPGMLLPNWRPDKAAARRGLPVDHDGFPAYRRQRELASDFFKPIPSAVSDTTLLRDSVYVTAYREEAWKRTRSRRTFGHYAIIGGSVIGGASVIAGFVIFMVALSRIKVG